MLSRPSVYDLSTLVAWLGTFPTDLPYNYQACDGTCLLDQYLTAHGQPSMGDHYCQLSDRTGWGALVASIEPHTFGAALARAKDLANV